MQVTYLTEVGVQFTVIHVIESACVRAILLAAAISPAQAAAIDVSTSRDIFQSAFAAHNLFGQNFDSYPSGATLDTVGGVSSSASQGHALVTSDFFATTPPNELGSTSFGYFGSGETAKVSFATPITAFAIDVNAFAPVSAIMLLHLTSVRLWRACLPIFENRALANSWDSLPIRRLAGSRQGIRRRTTSTHDGAGLRSLSKEQSMLPE